MRKLFLKYTPPLTSNSDSVVQRVVGKEKGQGVWGWQAFFKVLGVSDVESGLEPQANPCCIMWVPNGKPGEKRRGNYTPHMA